MIASDNAAFITGQIIRVNGGKTACVSAGRPDSLSGHAIDWMVDSPYAGQTDVTEHNPGTSP